MKVAFYQIRFKSMFFLFYILKEYSDANTFNFIKNHNYEKT